MMTLAEAAQDFLAQKRIAVVGVCRDSFEAANQVFRKLRDQGYEVFAVNADETELEGARCYPDVAAIPGGVDAVMIGPPASAAEQHVRECAALGIKRVWLHRGLGQGAVSDEAVTAGRELGLTLIPGACPAMFCQPDVPHRCFRWLLNLTGKLPRTVETPEAISPGHPSG